MVKDVKSITNNSRDISKFKGKNATFMLSLSNSETANIKGITQAGIPGLIYLTPTLDAEFIATGAIYSLDNIAETPAGVPTPALITRAIYLMRRFDGIEFLNLGLKVEPKISNTIHHFGIKPSGDITKGARIDAKEVFQKGLEFGKSYILDGDYLILAESVPSGTTTAQASALALGYDAKNYFSSSFKNVPSGVKEETIKKALANIEGESDIFKRLGAVSDNMLIFNAGFIIGAMGRFDIALAGGTQMAGVLLVAQSIAKELDIKIDSSNWYLWTTKWVAEDENSNIKALLEMLDFEVGAFYSDFDFTTAGSTHPALKLYDQGEAKEGVGAGGALVYGLINNLPKELIAKEVEGFLM
jgi:uncharacterized protein (TIGR00303 family)